MNKDKFYTMYPKFNLKEYKIMLGNRHKRDEDYFSQYHNIDAKKFNSIKNSRVTSPTISDFLKKITDRKGTGPKRIHQNINNCLYGRKACVLSCGHNITEHLDKLAQLPEEYTICCFKSSVTLLKSRCDILATGNHIVGDYFEKRNDVFRILFTNNHWDGIYGKTYNVFKIYKVSQKFLDNNVSLEVNNKRIEINDLMGCDIYALIVTLIFMGIKEIYLFGCYLDNKFIDIRKYNFNEDILCQYGHYYDVTYNRIKEPGFFCDHINSYYLKNFCDQYKAKIYNVSSQGMLSNKIPRINFEDVTKQIKTVIEPAHSFTDFMMQIEKYFDHKYYYNRYMGGGGADTPVNNIKKTALQNYISIGIYLNRRINKDDIHKNEVVINDFNKNMLIYTIIIMEYPFINKEYYLPYFAHYLAKFKMCLGVDIYDKNFTQEYFYEIIKAEKENIDKCKKLRESYYSKLKESNIEQEYIDNDYFLLCLYKLLPFTTKKLE